MNALVACQYLSFSVNDLSHWALVIRQRWSFTSAFLLKGLASFFLVDLITTFAKVVIFKARSLFRPISSHPPPPPVSSFSFLVISAVCEYRLENNVLIIFPSATALLINNPTPVCLLLLVRRPNIQLFLPALSFSHTALASHPRTYPSRNNKHLAPLHFGAYLTIIDSTWRRFDPWVRLHPNHHASHQ